MFAQVKIDCYYRVTTDSILGYIEIEMKKALKPLIHNDFKTSSFGDPSEIRTPDTLIKSVEWNVGALQYIKRVQGEVTRCVVAVFPLCQNLK